nr:MFS transporter [Aeromonas veronii]
MPVFLLCTFLMITLYPVGIDLYLVAVPQIADTLQASEAQIHTAFSIYLFGMAATVLLGGMIADRFGRRWVVLGGALIFVLASLVAGHAEGITQFYLGRFWQGGRGRCALYHDLYRAAGRAESGAAGDGALDDQRGDLRDPGAGACARLPHPVPF